MLLPSRLGYCCRRRGDAGNACSHVLVHSCTRMGGKAVGRGFTVHGQGSSGSGSAHQRLNKILSPPLHSLGSYCPRTLPAPGQHEPCVLVLPVRNALSPLLSLHLPCPTCSLPETKSVTGEERDKNKGLGRGEEIPDCLQSRFSPAFLREGSVTLTA